MKRGVLVLVGLGLFVQPLLGWGFYGHKLINRQAVFLLPPEMMIFYKPVIDIITEHAVDPDKRRYIMKEEGPRHYMDMDHYHPWDSIPLSYAAAVKKYGEDTLLQHGIVVWWIQIMTSRLTKAFEKRDKAQIIKLSADLGHYIGDLHVPLHASSNHNGQLTNQQGIHGFWESRIPELFASSSFDLINGKANYIKNLPVELLTIIIQSAIASDSVLLLERTLNDQFRADLKYSYENRNGLVLKQYSTAYSTSYHNMLNGMVERRMRESIKFTASVWYSAWINAGMPDLKALSDKDISTEMIEEWKEMNRSWSLSGSSTNCHN